VKVASCPHCDDPALAALADAVGADDIDRAIALGLLDFAPPITACTDCMARIETIVDARDARLRALAARERHRARQARLAEHTEARARRRAATAASAAITSAPVAAAPIAAAAPALPPAAAAALARARAKAATKRTE
jgi:hypothetical protein